MLTEQVFIACVLQPEYEEAVMAELLKVAKRPEYSPDDTALMIEAVGYMREAIAIQRKIVAGTYTEEDAKRVEEIRVISEARIAAEIAKQEASAGG